MSPSTDPKYFGKSAFSDLKNVSKAALDIMSGKKVQIFGICSLLVFSSAISEEKT